jgi:signal transduction histidine kinase
MTGRSLRSGSLRTRVLVAVLGVLTVVLIGVVVVVLVLFTVQSDRSLAAVLAGRAQLAQQLARQGVQPTALINRVDGRSVRVTLRLADGTQLGSLRGGVDAPKKRTVILRGTGDLAGARLTLVPDTALLTGVRARLTKLLLFTGIGALVVTAALLVLVVRRALAPLDAMTRLARQITRGGRGRRLAPRRTDTELGRTATAFDEMLDALEGAETNARHAEASARRAAEQTRRFVADATHELRTPIAGLCAVADAVIAQPADTGKAERDRLHRLLAQESHRAADLVENLLDLAKLDAGVELNTEPVELTELVRGQLDRIRLLHPDVAISLRGAECTVDADRSRITQIVVNLLENAAQATDGHGLIEARTYGENRYVVLEIADSGPGVPLEQRERIFERLVRLDEARDRRSGGAGIGLAIARGFARAHGGEVSCEPPNTGTGALFRLTLPAAPLP